MNNYRVLMCKRQLYNQFVIYSAVVGNYDEIKQPLVVDNRFDYILFSNEIRETNIGVWKIRPIPYTNKDNTRICRYVKTHPQLLLPEYKASVWMDSNIQIAKQEVYNRIVELYEQGILVASMCHPWRDCIYQEAFWVLTERLEEEKVVLAWGHFLRRHNYPRNNGLFETNFLYRMHTEPIYEMDELWWRCIDRYSKRDQLSFNYVLWEKRIRAEYVLQPRFCVRNTDKFVFDDHKHSDGRFVAIDENASRLLRYYHNSADVSVPRIYYLVYNSYNPSFAANCYGPYWVYIKIRICCRKIRKWIHNRK